MRPISDTIARLSRYRQQSSPPTPPTSNRLVEQHDFGSNPGSLRSFLYVSKRRPKDAALVVVLHGCTQTAADYDRGSGWSDLADREGFVVLFPEQQRQNNANLCFNWFNPADIARGSGEGLSIFQMIETTRRKHAIDPAKIYVTGLSAGGAMANVMLATYPEVFAGGAIIAGLPYGLARTIPEAFDRMRGHGNPSPAALTASVLNASDHSRPWPTISIWQGDADGTVTPSNARTIAAQWCGVHHVEAAPTETVSDGSVRRNLWRDATGRVVVEVTEVPGMGHGTPLKTSGRDACGSPGPFMLDVGISSTVEIARSWSLMNSEDDFAAQSLDVGLPAIEAPSPSLAPVVNRAVFERIVLADGAATGPGAIIEAALRKAGLMR